MRDADLTDANLAGATARECDLDNVDFTEAKLMMVDFSDTSLRGAVFTRAVIFAATLNGADLSDADLRAAQGLSQEQLDTAYGNRGTRLPEAFAAYAMTEKPTG